MLSHTITALVVLLRRYFFTFCMAALINRFKKMPLVNVYTITIIVATFYSTIVL